MLRRYPRPRPRSRRKSLRRNPQGPNRKALVGLTVPSVVYSQTNPSVVKIFSSVFIRVRVWEVKPVNTPL